MIYVAAAGNGSRIRQEMSEAGYQDIPKHLLPTGEPNGMSLIRRNTSVALSSGLPVTALVNPDNMQAIDDELKGMDVDLSICHARHPYGQFSFTENQTIGETRYSVAGDAYIEAFHWPDFMNAHEADTEKRPVSFLVGKTSVKKEAALFELDDSLGIKSFRRSERPQNDVFRNIGVYAVTLTPEVKEILDSFSGAETISIDLIVKELVTNGLAKAKIHEGTFFNINHFSDYEEMIKHNS